jgi:hypothetical protein
MSHHFHAVVQTATPQEAVLVTENSHGNPPVIRITLLGAAPII